MMRFVADEGVDAPIVRLLRQNDFDVFYIAEESPSIDDTIVLQKANAEIVLAVIQKHIDEIQGSFTVIQPGIVRIRKF